MINRVAENLSFIEIIKTFISKLAASIFIVLLAFLSISIPGVQTMAYADVTPGPGYSVTLQNNDLRGPVEVATITGGITYVANEGPPNVFDNSDFVSKLDSTGEFIKRQFISGLEGTSGLAADSMGNIYISQDAELRLRKYNSEGIQVLEFASHRPEFADPNTLKLTNDGRLLAPGQSIANGQWRILAFDTNTGQRLPDFTPEFSFNFVNSIFFQNGQLYIAGTPNPGSGMSPLLVASENQMPVPVPCNYPYLNGFTVGNSGQMYGTNMNELLKINSDGSVIRLATGFEFARGVRERKNDCVNVTDYNTGWGGSLYAICPASQVPPVGNRVDVALIHGNWYETKEDSINNVPIGWNHWWFTNIVNTPDGGSPVVNPRVALQTGLNLVGFQPNDPSIFSANPPLYTWNFSGLQLKELEGLPLSAWEPPGILLERPRYTASRSVEPAILTGDVTLQTVTATFRLEESLPPDLTYLGINIGKPIIAWNNVNLVETSIVSQIPVEGWGSNNDGVQAMWSNLRPSAIEVGKTYTFQATLRSIKSPNLLGSPLFKPTVQVGYNKWQTLPMVTGNTVTITDPSNIVSATFSADNAVDWNPGFSDTTFNFDFGPVVSQISGKQPPFRVLIPADTRIEPETLKMESKGVITAFVKLPQPYRVDDIQIDTVRAQGPTGALALRGNVAGDTLVLKFDRKEHTNLSPGNEVLIKVSGLLTDGSIFRGGDSIRVIP